MFVGCLHTLNYSSICMSILTSCAKVPDLCPAIGPFFFVCVCVFFFCLFFFVFFFCFVFLAE